MMRLDDFNTEEQIKEQIKKLPPNFNTLYKALIHKELPTKTIIDSIRTIGAAELSKATQKLTEKFLEIQRHEDALEAQKDREEVQFDALLEAQYEEEKKSLQRQLEKLQTRHAKQSLKYEKLKDAMSELSSTLDDYTGSQRTLSVDTLSQLGKKTLKKLKTTIQQTQTDADHLDSHIKQISSKVNFFPQLESIQSSLTQLETPIKALRERYNLRFNRKEARQARQNAEILKEPIGNRLSAENNLKLSKEITAVNEGIKTKKDLLEKETKALIHPFFLELMKNEFHFCPTIEKAKLGQIHEIALHNQTLEKEIYGQTLPRAYQATTPEAFDSQMLQNHLNQNHQFKKAAFFTAATSTLGSIAATAVFHLLLSTPPLLITASFLLLTAAIATAVVIHLHQRQLTLKETIKKANAAETLEGNIGRAEEIFNQYKDENPEIDLPMLETRPFSASSFDTIPAHLPSARSSASNIHSLFSEKYPLESFNESMDIFPTRSR